MAFCKINYYGCYKIKGSDDLEYRLGGSCEYEYINIDQILAIRTIEKRSVSGDVLYNIIDNSGHHCVTDEKSVKKILESTNSL
ncbi:MAG: hypothetical protein K6F64_09650 [Clostridia bacterium]|nr:hypothetical protein [Clostridia bacterium]